MLDITNLRREFTLKTLNKNEVLTNPINQFELWFQEAIDIKALEPNAMQLATVGGNSKPSCRTVLLKQLRNDGFTFFTNYESEKALQIDENPYCALTFVWHELERQVRIEGRAEKLLPEESDAYFEKRPEASKLGAWASPQSKPIPHRNYIERLIQKFELEFAGIDIRRPNNWGGYIVKPTLIEFWQGRENRLHDRIQYNLEEGNWLIERLAP